MMSDSDNGGSLILAGVDNSSRIWLRATRDGVRYFNDSIATNPESVYAAIDAIDGPLHWIGGGAGKNLDLRPLADRLVRRIDAAYCIGREGPQLVRLLEAFRGPRRRPVVRRIATLDGALTAASAACPSGGAVLLSPACASFDQFANFAARGDAFRAQVAALPSATAAHAP